MAGKCRYREEFKSDLMSRLLATHLSAVTAKIVTAEESFSVKILWKLLILTESLGRNTKKIVNIFFCVVLTLLVVYRWVLLLCKTVDGRSMKYNIKNQAND